MATAIPGLADAAIISVGSDQNIILYNRAAERIFGFRTEEVMGKPLDLLIPEQLAQSNHGYFRGFYEGAATHRRLGEILGRRKDGAQFSAEASISKANVNGIWIFTVSLRDLTNDKNAVAETPAPGRDAEALRSEIHHRIKNNLQVVSSLLGLQARLNPGPQTQLMFQENQNRIQSVMLLQERLRQWERLSASEYRLYICELAERLFRTYSVSNSRVNLQIHFDDVSMDLDAAVPCGLILNELVSNCLKHAFPDGRHGEVRVELRMEGTRLGSLIVVDSGIGLPENVSVPDAKSLGFRLLRILSKSLGAVVEVCSRPGTTIKLAFQPKNSDNHEGFHETEKAALRTAES